MDWWLSTKDIQGQNILNLTMAPVLLIFPGSTKCMGQNWVSPIIRWFIHVNPCMNHLIFIYQNLGIPKLAIPFINIIKHIVNLLNMLILKISKHHMWILIKHILSNHLTSLAFRRGFNKLTHPLPSPPFHKTEPKVLELSGLASAV